MATVWWMTCVLAVMVLLAGERADRLVLRAPAKTLASLAFLAHAWALEVPAQGGASMAVFGGLVLSAVGDLCLLSKQRSWFLAGLVAFLLGHVAYVVAFVMMGLAPLGLLSVVPVLALAGGIWRWLSPDLGDMARPVAAYIAVISTMVVCASMALAAEASTGRGVLLLAAVLFFVSDICVARDRFVRPGFPNRLVGLPLYYLAQILFGAGAALA